MQIWHTALQEWNNRVETEATQGQTNHGQKKIQKRNSGFLKSSVMIRLDFSDQINRWC